MKRHIAVFLLLCGLLHAEALRPTCYRDNDKNVVICSEKKLGRLMWQDEKQIFEGTLEQAQEYCKNLQVYYSLRTLFNIKFILTTYFLGRASL